MSAGPDHACRTHRLGNVHKHEQHAWRCLIMTGELWRHTISDPMIIVTETYKFVVPGVGREACYSYGGGGGGGASV